MSATVNKVADAATRRKYLRRALAFAVPFRRSVLLILLITLGLSAVNAAEPLILKHVIDGLGARNPMGSLVAGIGLLLLLGLFRELTAGCSNWLTWHCRQIGRAHV